MSVRTLCLALALSASSLAWVDTAEAACKEPVQSEDVGSALDRAEEAYRQLDPSFSELSAQIVASVPCLSDPASPELAARLHRQAGLYMAFQKNQQASRQAFAAARTIQSYYVFPEDLVPPDSPIRGDYEAISVDAVARTAIPDARDGTIRLDGDLSLERANDLPVVFQLIDATGKVVKTAYLWPGEAPPAYTVQKGKKPETGGVSKSALLATGASTALLGMGIGFVASGWADAGRPVCDMEAPSGLNVTQEEWCNGPLHTRIGVGYVLTGLGAAGLVGTSVVMLDGGGWMVGVNGRF